MKKTLAAVTAVILAAGISLAAAVGPATADDSSTPTPAATSTPAATPSTTPTPAATDKPSGSSTTPTSTKPAATTPAPASSQLTVTPTQKSIAKTDTATTTYMTVVWSMPSWSAQESATWPQKLISYTPEATETLSVDVPTTCGTQYQVDSYVDSAAFETWFTALKAKTPSILVNGADNAYLAGGGWNNAYKLVQEAGANCTQPCILDSTVSYTYTAATNSGDITIPNNANGTPGVLCQPFYVTATSWTYDGAGIWPQTIDKTQHVDGPNGNSLDSNGQNKKIEASGTYHYAAAVTCGQGDIYASFDKTAATLYPENDGLPATKTGYLNGPGTPFSEHFLSDMGFNGPSPTWVQQGADCFTPAPPTFTYLNCTAGSENSVIVPKVLGGTWTVTDGTNTYTTGTSVGGTYPTPGTSPYTVTLSDGNPTDGYTIATTSYPYQPKGTPDCRTVIPTLVAPTASAIQACDTTGSLTISPTVGVDYSVTTSTGTVVYSQGLTVVDKDAITGLTGNATVTADAETNYKFADGTTEKTFGPFAIGDETRCYVNPAVFGACTPITGATTATGTESVTLSFVNPSATPENVTVTGGTNKVNLSFQIPANTPASAPLTEVIDDFGYSGDTYQVTIGDQSPVAVTIPTFAGCTPSTMPYDPTYKQIVCTAATPGAASTATLGSISTDGNPDFIYTLTNDNDATFSEVFPSLPNDPTIKDLPAGDYHVSVVNAPGFVYDLSGDADFPFAISLVSQDCGGTVQTPASSSAQTCAATGIVPPTEVGSKPGTASRKVSAADTTYVDGGVIYLTQNPGVLVYSINNGSTTTPVDSSVAAVNEPDGSYTVTVALTAQAVTDGYVLADPSVSWQYTFDPFCPPTDAVWHAGASATNAVCTATSATPGVISLTHLTDESNKVHYKVVNAATGTVVYSGHSSKTLDVATGNYTITANAVNPKQGLTPTSASNGTNNSDGSQTFTVSVVQTGTDCGDGNLAFTGGTIAWLGFVLAGGMLFLGIALLFIRRRRNGTAQ